MPPPPKEKDPKDMIKKELAQNEELKRVSVDTEQFNQLVNKDFGRQF